MKSLVIAIASLIASVSANAQNATVYYAPVTTNMEVGLGFDRTSNQCILSIIEEADKAVDFNFDIINMNGESVLTSELSDGNINVMPKDKDGNYYQCNYALSVPELMDIIVNAKDNTVVIKVFRRNSAQLLRLLNSHSVFASTLTLGVLQDSARWHSLVK